MKCSFALLVLAAFVLPSCGSKEPKIIDWNMVDYGVPQHQPELEQR